MTSLTSFDTIITAEGEYAIAAMSPGTRVALTLEGVFEDATVTLGVATTTLGAATVTGTLTSDGETELTFAAMPRVNALNGFKQWNSGLAQIYGLSWGWTLFDVATDISFQALAAVESPDLVPAGAYDADTNPHAWQATGPATGTPVVAIAANSIAFTAILDGNNAAITATAPAAWEVVVPHSGRLAVKVENVTAGCAIRVVAVPIPS